MKERFIEVWKEQKPLRKKMAVIYFAVIGGLEVIGAILYFMGLV